MLKFKLVKREGVEFPIGVGLKFKYISHTNSEWIETQLYEEENNGPLGSRKFKSTSGIVWTESYLRREFGLNGKCIYVGFEMPKIT